MRFSTDPVRRLRLKIALTWGAGISVAVALGVWAATPRAATFSPAAAAATEATGAAADPGTAPLDVQAFAVELWRDPPEPDALAAAAPAPPTVKTTQIELLGISRAAGSLRANLYDARDDRIVIVAMGDRVRDYTVSRIAADHIELAGGGKTWTLSLEEPPA